MRYFALISLFLILEVQASVDVSKLNSFLEGHGNIISPRVVGGSEATPHSFPYQAALFVRISVEDTTSFCGGSLISDSHILTAAHCVDIALEVAVILGAHNLSEREPTQQIYFSKSFIVHSEWKPPLTHQNDIAIIRLDEKVEFSSAVQPIRLPKYLDKLKILVLKLATISGWGKDADTSTYISPVLRYVNQRIAPLLVCLVTYGPFNVGLNQLCVAESFGKAPCNGDSGGPLVLTENRVKILEGIVSFGSSRGCEQGYPSVFTRVSNFIPWIQQNTGISVGK